MHHGCKADNDPLPNSKDEKQIQALGQRILSECAAMLGGVDVLARHLDAPEKEVKEWIAGTVIPPAKLILLAVKPLIAKASKK